MSCSAQTRKDRYEPDEGPKTRKTSLQFVVPVLIALFLFSLAQLGWAGPTHQSSQPTRRPLLTGQPANQTVTSGQTASFSVVAEGASRLSYQWQKNGAAISGATASTYTTPVTSISDSGSQFIAVVTNGITTVKSKPAILTVKASLVTVTLSPTSTTIGEGSSQQFSGAVAGTSNPAIIWSISGNSCSGSTCGTISNGGLYVAPYSVPSPPTVTVTATSVADRTKTASASLTIVAAVVLSLSPTHASVPASATQLLNASLTGTSDVGVNWSLRGSGCSGSSCGTLSTSALSAVYSAPMTVPSPADVTVTATSATDPAISATATLTLASAVVVTVSPAATSVSAGSTQQFSASIFGASNTAVSWAVSGAGCSDAVCGTVSGSGLYTAPATPPSPGTVTVSATAVADSTKSAAASVTIAAIGLPPIGINVSEAEYSWGSFAGPTDLAYLKTNHVRIIRLPIAWERAQSALMGPLNQTYISGLTTFISAAGAQGMTVIVDLHDYGRYDINWARDLAANGVATPNTGSDEEIIGSTAVPISAFSDFWTKLAEALRGTKGLAYYDLMNEPYNMGSATAWSSAAQAAVNAIRSVDTSTSILVEGTQWASAYWWPSDNGSLQVNDPSHNLFYEAHLYFDNDGSGTYSESYTQQGAYPTIGVDRLQPFLTWLTQNHAKGFVGEFGVPNNDPLWLPVLDNFLTALQSAGLSGTYWNYAFHSTTDPSWWPATDSMSIINNGTADPQMTVLVQHNTQSAP
jgi:aryl-phospho-beta-D-glucosidase BglC (GH1 family)